MSEDGTHYHRGPGCGVTLHLPADLARALDACIAEQPEPRPERPDAILRALRDWLTGLGKLSHAERHEELH